MISRNLLGPFKIRDLKMNEYNLSKRNNTLYTKIFMAVQIDYLEAVECFLNEILFSNLNSLLRLLDKKRIYLYYNSKWKKTLNLSTSYDNYIKICTKDKEIHESLIIVIFLWIFFIFSVIPILFDSLSEAYPKVTNNSPNFSGLSHKIISCSSKVHCRSDTVDKKRWSLSTPFLPILYATSYIKCRGLISLALKLD